MSEVEWDVPTVPEIILSCYILVDSCPPPEIGLGSVPLPHQRQPGICAQVRRLCRGCTHGEDDVVTDSHSEHERHMRVTHWRTRSEVCRSSVGDLNENVAQGDLSHAERISVSPPLPDRRPQP